VDLVACELDHGHRGEETHGFAIARCEAQHGIAADAALDAGFAAGEDDAGGEALDVELEGPVDGFVEVVDVEGEVAVGCGEGTEVEDVCVAAKLCDDAGVGMAGQVGGHHWDGPAKEAEGAGGHALMLELDERRDAAALGLAEEIERIVLAGAGGELRMGRAGELLACGEAEGEAVGVGEGVAQMKLLMRCEQYTTDRLSAGRGA
jgi:hypothetical protein